MKRFCWHKWYIHNEPRENSLIHKFYNYGGIVVVIFAIFFSTAFSSGAIIYKLFGMNASSLLLCGLLLGFTHAFVTGYFACQIDTSDPWGKQDKSCLKCGKMVLEARKQRAEIANRDIARRNLKQEMYSKYEAAIINEDSRGA